jgi:hypothetical protein
VNADCPVCGNGTLTDIGFDAASMSDGEPAQTTDARQILTYSCGHTCVGPSLASANEEVLEVERRTSEETTDGP